MYFESIEVMRAIFKIILIMQFFQVPRVFVNGQFIGGGTDVKALYESGDLQKKLEA